MLQPLIGGSVEALNGLARRFVQVLIHAKYRILGTLNVCKWFVVASHLKSMFGARSSMVNGIWTTTGYFSEFGVHIDFTHTKTYQRASIVIGFPNRSIDSINS